MMYQNHNDKGQKQNKENDSNKRFEGKEDVASDVIYSSLLVLDNLENKINILIQTQTQQNQNRRQQNRNRNSTQQQQQQQHNYLQQQNGPQVVEDEFRDPFLTFFCTNSDWNKEGNEGMILKPIDETVQK